MSNTYEINQFDEVIPFTSGGKCLDTRAYREATDLELQQRDEIKDLETRIKELEDSKEEVKKDCAFQFYIGSRKIEDTDLITREEAEELWDKHEKEFIEVCKSNNKTNNIFVDDAEMALWINMNHPTNYFETARRISSKDVLIRDGFLYLLHKAI